MSPPPSIDANLNLKNIYPSLKPIASPSSKLSSKFISHCGAGNISIVFIIGSETSPVLSYAITVNCTSSDGNCDISNSTDQPSEALSSINTVPLKSNSTLSILLIPSGSDTSAVMTFFTLSEGGIPIPTNETNCPITSGLGSPSYNADTELIVGGENCIPSEITLLDSSNSVMLLFGSEVTMISL